MEEIWQDITGYENSYQISNKGQVRSKDRYRLKRWNKFGTLEKILYKSKLLKGQISHGYQIISLSKDGLKKQHYIHRLVAGAFIDNTSNKREVNHIDGNKLNNELSNLEWVSSKENKIHCRKNHLQRIAKGNDYRNAKLNDTMIKDILLLYHFSNISQHKIAQKYNVCQQLINGIVNRKRWKHIPEPGEQIKLFDEES
jgi:hypothetical protein